MRYRFTRKIKTPLVALIILIALAALSQSPEIFSATAEVTDTSASIDQETSYPVVRVVDGDTLIIDINGTEEKVRLIGIDTPESVHPDENRNTEFGEIASAYTKDRLEGENVSLELDVEERDQYGRLLAYVYLDGEMFNLNLVREGYAVVATYPPNVKYVEDFVAAQKAAREDGVGLWQGVLTDGAYVTSLNGSKYHLATCAYAKEIDEKNQIWFADKASAEAAGYEPCSVCQP